MSSHVYSRWYRAPEVALTQKRYDIAADMWGIGCIIFELVYNVHYKKEVDENIKLRKFATGDCCFPMSPSKKEEPLS